jgi:hypothetical protein
MMTRMLLVLNQLMKVDDYEEDGEGGDDPTDGRR